ncbi:AbrB/MazE/SpoVT family DNA-binding domain-containing protein [Hydrogenophaga sp. SL48]|nr:AbrB/MazE/SpoVT family DNA-binding domain-containing protein [Hydrogenophaga sp. SL48]
MPATVKLSNRFQIAIPKAIRVGLRWDAGQEVMFIPRGKGVLLMPVPQLDDLSGLAQGARHEGHRDRHDRY